MIATTGFDGVDFVIADEGVVAWERVVTMLKDVRCCLDRVEWLYVLLIAEYGLENEMTILGTTTALVLNPGCKTLPLNITVPTTENNIDMKLYRKWHLYRFRFDLRLLYLTRRISRVLTALKSSSGFSLDVVESSWH